MKVDTEKLRALLAAATPLPGRDPATGDVAALIAAAVNALPELLDRVSRLQGTLVAVAEWWGGPEHHADDCPEGGNCPDCIMARSINDACADRVEPPCVACEDVEGLRAKLATAEAERLTLARGVRTGTGDALDEVTPLARRIVAEADAASKEVGRG